MSAPSSKACALLYLIVEATHQFSEQGRACYYFRHPQCWFMLTLASTGRCHAGRPRKAHWATLPRLHCTPAGAGPCSPEYYMFITYGIGYLQLIQARSDLSKRSSLPRPREALCACAFTALLVLAHAHLNTTCSLHSMTAVSMSEGRLDQFPRRQLQTRCCRQRQQVSVCTRARIL